MITLEDRPDEVPFQRLPDEVPCECGKAMRVLTAGALEWDQDPVGGRDPAKRIPNCKRWWRARVLYHCECGKHKTYRIGGVVVKNGEQVKSALGA